MKTQLIQTLTKALLVAFVATITIGAMEKPTQIPDITFKITNKQTSPLLLKFGTYEQRKAMEPQRAEIDEMIAITTEPQQWDLDANNNPNFTINILNFHGETTKDLLQFTFKKSEGLLTVTAHNNPKKNKLYAIDISIPYIMPIKVTNEDIEIGELEQEQVYHTQELPKSIPTQRIIIKGQEFQVPQELIKLRAPALEKLTQ